MAAPAYWLLAALASLDAAPRVAVVSAEPSPASDDVGDRGPWVLLTRRPDVDVGDRVLAGVQAVARQNGVTPRVVVVEPGATTTSDRVALARDVVGTEAGSHVVWIDPDVDRITVFVVLLPDRRVFAREVPVVPGKAALAVESAINIAAAALEIEDDPTTIGLSEVATDAPTDGGIAESTNSGAIEQDQRRTGTAGETTRDTGETGGTGDAAERPAASARDVARRGTDTPRARRDTSKPRARRSSATTSDRPDFVAYLAVGYAGGNFATRVPWQHAIGLAAAFAPRPRLAIGLRYDVAIPIDVAAPVAFRLWRHPIGIFSSYGWPFAKRWDVELTARVTIDPIVRRADAGRSQIQSTADQTRVFVSGGAGIGIGIAVHPRVRLGLSIFGEGLVTRAAWVVRDPERTVVISPHAARGIVEAQIRVFLGRRGRKAATVTRIAPASPPPHVTCKAPGSPCDPRGGIP